MTNVSTARWALLLAASVGTIAILRFSPDSSASPVLVLAAVAPALLILVAACVFTRNPVMHRIARSLTIALVTGGIAMLAASPLRPAPVSSIDDPRNPFDQINDGRIGPSFGTLELATADPILVVSILVLAARLLAFVRDRIRSR